MLTILKWVKKQAKKKNKQTNESSQCSTGEQSFPFL